jgi:hypothetical protein
MNSDNLLSFELVLPSTRRQGSRLRHTPHRDQPDRPPRSPRHLVQPDEDFLRRMIQRPHRVSSHVLRILVDRSTSLHLRLACQHDQHAQSKHPAPLGRHDKRVSQTSNYSTCFWRKIVCRAILSADAADGHETCGSLLLLYTHNYSQGTL